MLGNFNFEFHNIPTAAYLAYTFTRFERREKKKISGLLQTSQISARSVSIAIYKNAVCKFWLSLAVLLALFCHTQSLEPSLHNDKSAYSLNEKTRCSWNCTVLDSDFAEEMKATIAKKKVRFNRLSNILLLVQVDLAMFIQGCKLPVVDVLQWMLSNWTPRSAR